MAQKRQVFTVKSGKEYIPCTEVFSFGVTVLSFIIKLLLIKTDVGVSNWKDVAQISVSPFPESHTGSKLSETWAFN